MSWSLNSTRRRPLHVWVYKGEELVWSARTAGRTLQVAGLEAGELYTVKTSHQACGADATAALTVRTGECPRTRPAGHLWVLVPPPFCWPRDSHPPSPGSQGRTGRGVAFLAGLWGSHILGVGLWGCLCSPRLPLRPYVSPCPGGSLSHLSGRGTVGSPPSG